VIPLASQIGINYRHSSLSTHAGDEDFEVKAGDRMPYVLFDGNGIYDKLRRPTFHLLVFANEPNKFQKFSDELGNQYSELMDFNVFPISPEVAEAFGTEKEFGVHPRFTAVAKPAKVRTDDCESLGQYRRDVMPADMSLRVAVQEQDGKTAATANKVDGGSLSLCLLTNELVKHGSSV
jgi:hypothetical protein